MSICLLFVLLDILTYKSCMKNAFRIWMPKSVSLWKSELYFEMFCVAVVQGQIDFHAYWSTCWPRGGRSSSWKSCLKTPAAQLGGNHWWYGFSASTHFTRRWRTWTWITRSSSASVRCRSRLMFSSFPQSCVTLLRWRKKSNTSRAWCQIKPDTHFALLVLICYKSSHLECYIACFTV